MHILTTKFKQPKKTTMQSQALETQTSFQAGVNCEVKTRFFKNWAKREIFLNLQEQLLYLIFSETGRMKSYNLNQVSHSKNLQENTIKLRVCPTRSYEVKSNPLLEKVLKDIDYYHSCKKMQPETYELKAPQPRKIDYSTSIGKPHKQTPEKIIVTFQPETSKKSQIVHKQKIKSLHQFEREVSYIKQQDWKIDHKNGGLLFINKQKKHLIPKMISYTAKKLISSGSFVNINFPTFAMKPESALQTYCKCLGSVPIILNNVESSPLERMKAFNVILLTMSIQMNDIEKPFNAVLGQTFQGQIGGNPVYAEQISTKPSVSSFLLVGRNYRLYGNLELKANVGLNQAIGVFHGNVTLEFEDGTKIVGIMPKGIMSGVIFGDTVFGPTGALYTYDAGHKLVCSFQTKKGDTMIGQIGKIKESALHKFEKNIKQKSVEEYSHVNQKDYETILSKMQVVYTDSISYDGKLYFSYSNKHNLPIKMTKPSKNEQLLPSDSSFRQDIRLRKLINIKDSQEKNDQLERQEERLRKLRRSELTHSKSAQFFHKKY